MQQQRNATAVTDEPGRRAPPAVRPAARRRGLLHRWLLGLQAQAGAISGCDAHCIMQQQ